MQEIKKTTWINPKNIVMFLLGVGCMYLFITNMIQARFSDLELQTRVLIKDQQATLAAIAETTARNGADSVTESIIKDCSISERSRFDELLNGLNNNLAMSELIELERLFGRCGGFYAERKSIMIARLAREIQIYETYINQLAVLLKEDLSETYKVAEWKQLALLEKEQSDLFTELVSKQNEIISTLLSGSNAGSAEITAILQTVREVQENLVVTRKRAETIRSNLTSL